jgi:hypothetical protein
MRPDGIQWVIDREKYESYPNRRYTKGEAGSARIPAEVSLSEVYDQFNGQITQRDLRNTPIEGDVRQVLDYYRVAEEYQCLPITTSDSQLAVKKV